MSSVNSHTFPFSINIQIPFIYFFLSDCCCEDFKYYVEKKQLEWATLFCSPSQRKCCQLFTTGYDVVCQFVICGINYVEVCFPCGSAGTEYSCNEGDLDSRSPGEGNSYPLQYSGLENFIDSIVHGITKSWTRLSNFHFS